MIRFWGTMQRLIWLQPSIWLKNQASFKVKVIIEKNSHKAIIKVIWILGLNVFEDGLLVQDLWFCLSELHVSFFELFILALDGRFGFLMVALDAVYYWVFWFIKLFIAFILVQNRKVRLAYNFRINIFLRNLRFYCHRLGHLFWNVSRLSYASDFVEDGILRFLLAFRPRFVRILTRIVDLIAFDLR